MTMQGVKTAVVRLFPIALFTLPFGLAFGVAALEAGLTDVQAISMSVLAFYSAAQFAALGFWGETIALGSGCRTQIQRAEGSRDFDCGHQSRR